MRCAPPVPSPPWVFAVWAVIRQVFYARCASLTVSPFALVESSAVRSPLVRPRRVAVHPRCPALCADPPWCIAPHHANPGLLLRFQSYSLQRWLLYL